MAPKTSISIRKYNKNEGTFKLYSGFLSPRTLAFLKIRMIIIPSIAPIIVPAKPMVVMKLRMPKKYKRKGIPQEIKKERFFESFKS